MFKKRLSGRGIGFLLVTFVAAGLAAAGFMQAAPASGSALQAPATSVAKGGRLFDKWWTEAGLSAPAGNQALWATQTTNTRTGLDTWRCKECHAWDYVGKDGAYGSGSHKTGFVGVSDAGKNKTVEQLTAIMKGSTNPGHNFSAVLSDALIGDLVSFLKEGLIDPRQYIDYATKKPKQANDAHGKELYSMECAACHGADGTLLNFGSAASPEYVGTIASDNPQEFLHKVRLGQPGTAMPSAFVSGWSMQDVVDVLAHAQTLPTAAPAPAALPKTGDAVLPQAVVPGVLVLSLLLIGAGLGLRRRYTRA